VEIIDYQELTTELEPLGDIDLFTGKLPVADLNRVEPWPDIPRMIVKIEGLLD
jgi:hypothetical protein